MDTVCLDGYIYTFMLRYAPTHAHMNAVLGHHHEKLHSMLEVQ